NAAFAIVHPSRAALVRQANDGFCPPLFFALTLRWHVTCKHSSGFNSMATKVRLLKMLQEMRGLAQITQRHPPPRLPGLFLLQLRSHLTQTTVTRTKRVIPIVVEDRPDISHPVKINHVPVRIYPLPRLGT